MGTWNYRVVRRQAHGQPYLALHEVHYDDAGKPTGMTKEPCRFVCEDEDGAESIAASLMMAHSDAIKRPILDDPWPDN